MVVLLIHVHQIPTLRLPTLHSNPPGEPCPMSHFVKHTENRRFNPVAEATDQPADGGNDDGGRFHRSVGSVWSGGLMRSAHLMS